MAVVGEAGEVVEVALPGRVVHPRYPVGVAVAGWVQVVGVGDPLVDHAGQAARAGQIATGDGGA